MYFINILFYYILSYIFGNMETSYNFICGSKKRSVAYYEKVQNEYLAEQRG